MRSLLKYFFLGVLIGLIPATIWVVSTFETEKVLSVAATPTPLETPSPTPTETPTPIPTPTPKPTLKPSPIPPPPPPVSPQEIHAFIERFAAQYAVESWVLRYIAICESGFHPLAVNGPYVGLYQFWSVPWKNFRLQIGEDPDPYLRFNAEEAVQTAAFAISQGKTSIWPNCTPK